MGKTNPLTKVAKSAKTTANVDKSTRPYILPPLSLPGHISQLVFPASFAQFCEHKMPLALLIALRDAIKTRLPTSTVAPTIASFVIGVILAEQARLQSHLRSKTTSKCKEDGDKKEIKETKRAIRRLDDLVYDVSLATRVLARQSGSVLHRSQHRRDRQLLFRNRSRRYLNWLASSLSYSR